MKGRKLTQRDLCHEISARTGYLAEEIDIIIDAFANVVLDEVMQGGSVRILNFGNFIGKIRKEYTIKNCHLIHLPSQDTTIPQMVMLKFDVPHHIKKLVDSVNKKELENATEPKKRRRVRKRVRD